MADFKEQIDATEAAEVTKLVTELREIAAKGQASEAGVTADQIREAINKTQQASLGLFKKVYEKKNEENAKSSEEAPKTEEKKD